MCCDAGALDWPRMSEGIHETRTRVAPQDGSGTVTHFSDITKKPTLIRQEDLILMAPANSDPPGRYKHAEPTRATRACTRVPAQ